MAQGRHPTAARRQSRPAGSGVGSSPWEPRTKKGNGLKSVRARAPDTHRSARTYGRRSHADVRIAFDYRSAGDFEAGLLAAAFASFLLSVYLYFGAEDKTAGIFVGLWVPSIQSLGALLLAGDGVRR